MCKLNVWNTEEQMWEIWDEDLGVWLPPNSENYSCTDEEAMDFLKKLMLTGVAVFGFVLLCSLFPQVASAGEHVKRKTKILESPTEVLSGKGIYSAEAIKRRMPKGMKKTMPVKEVSVPNIEVILLPIRKENGPAFLPWKEITKSRKEKAQLVEITNSIVELFLFKQRIEKRELFERIMLRIILTGGFIGIPIVGIFKKWQEIKEVGTTIKDWLNGESKSKKGESKSEKRESNSEIEEYTFPVGKTSLGVAVMLLIAALFPRGPVVLIKKKRTWLGYMTSFLNLKTPYPYLILLGVGGTYLYIYKPKDWQPTTGNTILDNVMKSVLSTSAEYQRAFMAFVEASANRLDIFQRASHADLKQSNSDFKKESLNERKHSEHLKDKNEGLRVTLNDVTNNLDTCTNEVKWHKNLFENAQIDYAERISNSKMDMQNHIDDVHLAEQERLRQIEQFYGPKLKRLAYLEDLIQNNKNKMLVDGYKKNKIYQNDIEDIEFDPAFSKKIFENEKVIKINRKQSIRLDSSDIFSDSKKTIFNYKKVDEVMASGPFPGSAKYKKVVEKTKQSLHKVSPEKPYFDLDKEEIIAPKEAVSKKSWFKMADDSTEWSDFV